MNSNSESRFVILRQNERADQILKPSGQKLVPVSEATMYPAQFPILLRDRMQGKTVAEVAELLGIPPDQVNRLLAGEWRPTRGICEKMGLKVVYAFSGTHRAEIG